jgi:hypothetical protein
MADDDSDEETIELGSGEPVEGAPLARVSARLMWGIEKSTIVDREGETLVRTPDGPRELGEILAAVDTTYFDTRQTFEDAVHDVIGPGAVPTAGGSAATSEDEQSAAPGSGDQPDDEDEA